MSHFQNSWPAPIMTTSLFEAPCRVSPLTWLWCIQGWPLGLLARIKPIVFHSVELYQNYLQLPLNKLILYVFIICRIVLAQSTEHIYTYPYVFILDQNLANGSSINLSRERIIASIALHYTTYFIILLIFQIFCYFWIL